MDNASRWQAVKQRDAAQDGRFVYGVITTGIYCRPSCPSRLPLLRNIRFYANPALAEAAGLRACKRCRPQADSAVIGSDARLLALCDWIEHHPDARHTLKTLAARVRLSPYYFQRRFKKVTGVSPRQFADASRMRRLKQALRTAPSVTHAVYDAGFGSASRAYDRSDTRLGMTPQQYRRGGAGVTISFATANTPLGLLLIAATDRGLCCVQFGKSEKSLRAQLAAEYPAATLAPRDLAHDGQFAAWMTSLIAYLRDGQPLANVPTDPQGTAFQLKVWRYLQRIPAGAVRSYTEVASAIGQPKAVRAVASACARNRIALLIPCHRVIRGDGGLGGFRWGLKRKQTLLECERAGLAVDRDRAPRLPAAQN